MTGISLLAGAVFAPHVQGAWNGLGVSGGTTGADICDTANWVGGVIDGDFVTIDTAGTYTLTMSSDMDRTQGAAVTGGAGERLRFGCVDGVQLTIASDAAGTPRTLTSGGIYRMGVITTNTPTTVTFSEDIQFNVISTLTVAQGAQLGGGLNLPTVTVNGPMTLGATLLHTGGNLILNGWVTGAGALQLGGNFGGGSVYTTLTCPSNTFSGGILAGQPRDARLTATASTVLANQGQPSALGSGGVICFPSNQVVSTLGITLSGFSTPQETDRDFVLTSTYSSLYNNGASPLRLTGAISDTANPAGKQLRLLGDYNSHSSPNVISGPILQQSPSVPITLQIMGAGIWRLTHPASTFSGSVKIQDNYPEQGLQFLSAGALGLNDVLLLGWPEASRINYFTFLGDEACTVNKDIVLDGYYHRAINHLIANGEGTLTLSGKFDPPTLYNASSANRSLAFGGTGEGLYTGAPWLTNRFNNTDVYSIDLLKRGSGCWRFSGEHLNHEGKTEVHAGNLTLDYAQGDQLTSSTNRITLNESKLTLRGAPGGTTGEAIHTLTLSENNYQFNTLELDANGGDGVHLTLGTLAAANANLLLTHLFDLSSSPGNTLTANALSSLSIVYGMLMRGNRAVCLIKTADGVSFATTNGVGQVVPCSNYTPYLGDAVTGSITNNYLFTSSISHPNSRSIWFSTITADASDADLTVDLTNGRFYCTDTGSGRSILARGGHNITFRSANVESCRDVWFHNYLTNNAALTLDFNLPASGTYNTPPSLDVGAGTLTFSGPGLTVVDTRKGLGSRPTLAEGVLRLIQTAALPTSLLPTNCLTLTAGGVLEVGADLNGAEAGDFSLTCGVAQAGIFLFSGAGFSAYDADRVVNLGGAGATLEWGRGAFLTSATYEDHGFAFKLSSPYANATVDFQNPIALNVTNSPYGFRRTVEVADGSAAVDAVLSGAISGDSSLVKTGAGTLKVTAAQSYRELRVNAGTFLADDGCFSTSDAVPVCLKSGTTLAGAPGASNTFGTLTLAGDATLDVGDGTAELAFADSSACDWAGSRLSIQGQLQNGKVRFGADAEGLSAAQLGGITLGGGAVARIDANGYLVRIPFGTLIRVQ